MSELRRSDLLARLRSVPSFDVLVIGGGATGLGVAVSAARRGLRVALLESHDFAKGTSSRSTKLVHGGVRYLAQGHLSLVREALHERRLMLKAMPHLAQPLAFVLPAYRWWQPLFYGIGLKLYDWLAGADALGPTRWLSAAQTRQHLPGVQAQGLWGGVQYWDGQFDDARFAVELAREATAAGACVLNHCAVQHLLYDQGRVVGVQAQDEESGQALALRAGCVVNATGVWVDQFRPKDTPMVAPSQGVHLVVDAHFLAGTQALLVPRTEDGRVLFAVPWLGKVILGTTDTPRQDLPREPQALEEEIEFILREAGRVLRRKPLRADVRSVWVGLRPLIRPQAATQPAMTRQLSREHWIDIGSEGMLHVSGGKWTTYRAIAEDVLRHAVEADLLPASALAMPADAPPGDTTSSPQAPVSLTQAPGPHLYGAEQSMLAQMPGHACELAPGLTEAMVRFAVRYEMARTVEDVLARRSRLLFLDAQAAQTVAPRVAALLQEEGCEHVALEDFQSLAKSYLLG